MTTSSSTIRDLVVPIKPHDPLESDHITDVLAWIDSGAPLFRVSKPDNPPKHLVSYFVLFDENTNTLLLVDHIKADAWLPTGGHVEQDEDPRTAVTREASEELKIAADFSTRFGDRPLFITVTKTKGPGTHIDVSLWFVIRGDSSRVLDFDTVEMNAVRWLSPQEILDTDINALDPHMHRFIHKLIAR